LPPGKLASDREAVALPSLPPGKLASDREAVATHSKASEDRASLISARNVATTDLGFIAAVGESAF
jgi:hypothetical protein